MRRFSYICIFLIACFSISVQLAKACTVDIEPLRKTFRQSKYVFIGEIVSVESIEKSELPEKLKKYDYLVKLTFKVENSWKGNSKNITIYSSPFCSCPWRQYNFSVGKRFLVFADKNSYFDVCNLSNIEVDSDENNNLNLIIKRLDKFWFRTWASIYPL